MKPCIGSRWGGVGGSRYEGKYGAKKSALKQVTLLQIFLNMRNLYGTFDIWGCLDIQWVYGIGTRVEKLLEAYWACQYIPPKAGEGVCAGVHSGAGGVQGGPHVANTIQRCFRSNGRRIVCLYSGKVHGKMLASSIDDIILPIEYIG